MEQNLYKGHEEAEDEEGVDHLDVRCPGQGVGDTDEESSQNEKSCHIHRYDCLEFIRLKLI